MLGGLDSRSLVFVDEMGAHTSLASLYGYSPCGQRTCFSAHKGEWVRKLIEERGCQLLYLPPYSPDLNPIEEAFSKAKRLLRVIGAR
jgi:hypothetical protein